MPVLEFGSVLWSPVILIIAAAAIAVLVAIFRARGQKGYKKDTPQTRVFLSGEEVPSAELVHIRAHNIYWGFFESLKGYYDVNIKAHTGIINDFIIWFVILTVLATLIIFVVG